MFSKKKECSKPYKAYKSNKKVTKKKVKKENKNILLLCGEGYGNVLWVTPCVIILYKLGYNVDILCESYWPDAHLIFKDSDCVRKIYIDENKVHWKTYKHIIQTRWGRKHNEQTERYMKLDLSKFHEIDENFTIIKNFDIDAIAPLPVFSNLKWKGFSKDKNKVLVVDPKVRQQIWNRRKYPHIYDLVISLLKMNLKVSILGSEEDKKAWPKFPPNVNLIVKPDIHEAAKTMSEFDLFIGQDCGLTQIAAALNMPTIALFGPTRTSKNAPRGNKVIIVKQDLPCIPCQLKQEFGKCKNFKCMDFSIKLLIREVRKFI